MTFMPKPELVLIAVMLAIAAGTCAGQCDPQWVGDVGATGAAGLTAFDPSNPSVRAFAVWDDGTGPALYAGGDFLTIGGVLAHGIAKWDGVAWSALGDGVLGGMYYQSNDTYVSALEAFDDGSGSKLYAGGKFATAGGVASPNIARWNGTSWEALGTGCNQPVSALKATVLMGFPMLVVGGHFQLAGGVPSAAVASYSAVGWQGFYPGVPNNGYVSSIEVWDPGIGPGIYLGGKIGFLGVAARWDLTGIHGLGSFGPGTGSTNNGFANKIKVLDLGSGPALYVGGTWSANVVGDTQTLAKFQNGQWSAATTPTGPLDAVKDFDLIDLGAGPRLTVATDRVYLVPTYLQGVASWDGSAWIPLAPAGMITSSYTGHGGVHALKVVDEPRGRSLYCGGEFDYADSLACPSHGIARYGAPKPLLQIAQTGGQGSPGWVRNGGLIPGHEYFNLFSLESCPGAVGSGPFFGLCATDLWFLLAQAFSPIGNIPYHFVATEPSVAFGPFSVSPGVHVEGVAIDVSYGTPNCTSAVVPFTVQ